MIPSMFNLDHRLSELRPTADELRVARELRDADDEAARPLRVPGPAIRMRLGGARGARRLATR